MRLGKKAWGMSIGMNAKFLGLGKTHEPNGKTTFGKNEFREKRLSEK
jgi:hypothetical protein